MKTKSFGKIFAAELARLNGIIYKSESCNKDVHIHSRAEHNSSEEHIEILNRIESRNIIKKDNNRRFEIRNNGINGNTFSKHLNSIITIFSNSVRETERKAQTESDVKQHKNLFQFAKANLGLTEELEKEMSRKMINPYCS